MLNNRIDNKKLINDLLLFSGILLVALLALLITERYRKSGTVCVVWLEGEEYARLSLLKDSVTELAGCRICVKNGQVYMEEADCPGQDCVHMKPISEEGQVIACLPNKIVLEIKGNNEYHSVSYLDVFDTVTTITAYTTDAAEFAALSERIHNELMEYHKLFDIYHEYSGLYNACTLNREISGESGANGNDGEKSADTGISLREAQKQIPEALYELLERSVEFYDLTEGRVNIAMGPVLSIWHEAREYGIENPDKAYVPSASELAEAGKHCDLGNLVLHGDGYISVKDIMASFDLGAVAKGFATEKVAQGLEKDGYTGILLNVGGNIRAVGAPPGGTWNIGIENPAAETGKNVSWLQQAASSKSTPNLYVAVVGITSQAVVTSGDYQRFYTVGDRRYSHIIDPETLFPAEKVSSVTVICSDSALADALSTALFIMAPDEAIDFAESLDNVEALVVCKNGAILKTTGFPDYEVRGEMP